MNEKYFMARVFDSGHMKDLNEMNEGYPVYFKTLVEAKQALQAFCNRSPRSLDGCILQIKNGGHYQTIGYYQNGKQIK